MHPGLKKTIRVNIDWHLVPATGLGNPESDAVGEIFIAILVSQVSHYLRRIRDLFVKEKTGST